MRLFKRSTLNMDNVLTPNNRDRSIMSRNEIDTNQAFSKTYINVRWFSPSYQVNKLVGYDSESPSFKQIQK